MLDREPLVALPFHPEAKTLLQLLSPDKEPLDYACAAFNASAGHLRRSGWQRPGNSPPGFWDVVEHNQKYFTSINNIVYFI